MTESALKVDMPTNYKRILAGDMVRADFGLPHYHIVVRDENVNKEDVLQPEFWAHLAAIFSADIERGYLFPIVTLDWADGQRHMSVKVIYAGKVEANVRCLTYYDWRDDADKIDEIEVLASNMSKTLSESDKGIKENLTESVESNEEKEVVEASEDEEKEEEGAEEDQPVDDAPKYAVKYKGPKLKFIVYRVADDEILADGMSKADAQKWLKDYEKAMS